MVQRAQGIAETQHSMQAYSGTAGMNSALNLLTQGLNKQTQATVKQTAVQMEASGMTSRQGGGGFGVLQAGGGGSFADMQAMFAAGGGAGGGGGGGKGKGVMSKHPGAAVGFVASASLSNLGLGDVGDVVSQGLHGFNAGMMISGGNPIVGAAGAMFTAGASAVGGVFTREKSGFGIDANEAIANNPFAGAPSARARARVGADFDRQSNEFLSTAKEYLGGYSIAGDKALAQADLSGDPDLIAADMLDSQLKNVSYRLSREQLRYRSELNKRRASNMVSNYQDAQNNGLFNARGEPTGSQE